MSTILVWKEELQMLYAKHAVYVEKALKFILGLAVFGLINSNIGFMKAAASMLCTIGLSAVCAFLPLTVMVIAASVLILAHFYALSLPVAAVAGAIFLVMYIFYFRFTPKKAWLVLLTPIAFAFKIPYIIPIAFGLVGTPVYAIPVACGSIVYYMLHYVKGSSAALKGTSADSMVKNFTAFAKQVLQNKEMWVIVVAFALCLLVVYTIRTKSADHSWKVAIVTGAIINVIVIVIGDVTFDIHIAYVGLIFGSIFAIALGAALEFFIFTVDYSRTERMQFEDDEYYYYVKAVPKIMVPAPVKKIKKINEHKETTTIDTDAIRKVAMKQKIPAAQKEAASTWKRKNADEILFKKSLDKDLGISTQSTPGKSGNRNTSQNAANRNNGNRTNSANGTNNRAGRK
ncbi:hypothetical protein [Hespellia stercorisuis]|uniref:Uncharacterized protein n=1 Tax=Hespellia stercorisuis DSM 15480 TaxID=1121950 RepID=A0A1M6TXK7_9FIRM|nr:hypothetical protein [Hespellia stercorisuis]SHK61762.1 hypothetical protein SAMN02745243_03352 [Hespellia stercorisuis DSM 15480]